jgi:hypothetical protein
LLEKLKGYLDSSWTWLVAAVGAILYFWVKERDLEDKLEESKANEKIQTDNAKISDADAAAQSQLDHYESLLRQYNAERADVPNGTPELRQGSEAPTSADPNKG